MRADTPDRPQAGEAGSDVQGVRVSVVLLYLCDVYVCVCVCVSVCVLVYVYMCVSVSVCSVTSKGGVCTVYTYTHV